MRQRASSKNYARAFVALLLGAGLCALPVSFASATSSSPTQEIIANGYTSINTIRSFFFCETTACKKTKATAATKAAKSMKLLESEASALRPSEAPASQRPVLKKFIDDVTSLAKVYAVYSSETSSEQIAQNTGVIYYESANVGSDVYLMTSAVGAKKALFADWGVGAVAVLYTMQVETQVLNSKKSSAATEIDENNNLEQDSRALRKDANGPNAQFNALLITFARAQERVSEAENAVLMGKKPSLTNAQLKVDISNLASQFANIVNRQKALIK